MVWIWGGNTFQIAAPDYLMGPISTPIVVAVKSSGEAVLLQYPRVRLVIFAAAVLIGIGMWLALNRTRIGVMIRAGVDDRDMLSVLGYQPVFALVFAFGAGLAGMAGIVGGTFQSISLGEDSHFSWHRCRWSSSGAWDRYPALHSVRSSLAYPNKSASSISRTTRPS
jgi:branched-chain amino acid transport system permease protein